MICLQITGHWHAVVATLGNEVHDFVVKISTHWISQDLFSVTFRLSHHLCEHGYMQFSSRTGDATIKKISSPYHHQKQNITRVAATFKSNGDEESAPNIFHATLFCFCHVQHLWRSSDSNLSFVIFTYLSTCKCILSLIICHLTATATHTHCFWSWWEIGESRALWWTRKGAWRTTTTW